MKRLGFARCVVATVLALAALTSTASAQDTLKVAAPYRGAWETAAPELGQQAGIFKKHGISLDLLYTRDAAETEQRVTSGASASDVGLDVSAMAAMRAYTRTKPVRIIGANTTGSATYWYVLATSPLKTIKDMVGKTIAFAAHGSPSHYEALDLIKEHRLKARVLLTGGAAATLNQLTRGEVDVGWASPPVGLKELDEGKIRIVARANEVKNVKGKTVSVLIANAGTLQNRKDVIARFMQAYRETVAWMYSDPEALKRYAEFAGVSEEFAKRLRDEFFTKQMLAPDQIVGLTAIMKDAVTEKYIERGLSRKQIAELIQIPAAVR
jgi:NitT/TauT family transport system substrate-binding protein